MSADLDGVDILRQELQAKVRPTRLAVICCLLLGSEVAIVISP